MHPRPDDKRPTASLDNPSLSDIIDTEERYFATSVGGVTFEEFLVFKRMFKRQLREGEEDEDSDDEN